MKDEIVIAEALNGNVRIHAARTTAMVNEAQKAHDMYPTSCAALGRVMTAAALMASDLKNPEEHVVVKINGGGPIGSIQVQVDGAGHVRGYADNPKVYLVKENGHLDVGKAVGTDGSLSVSRDMGLKEPFTGIVPLQTGEIGNDFAYYYAVSEQTPSVVAVGVLVNHNDMDVQAAGGMIIQLLPDAQEDIIEKVEAVSKTMKPMTEYIKENLSVEEIIKTLFPDAVIMQHKPVEWHCDCSKDHFAEALSGLHTNDLQDMIHEDHGAEIICHFCGKKYHFSEEELREILTSKNNHADRRS